MANPSAVQVHGALHALKKPLKTDNGSSHSTSGHPAIAPPTMISRIQRARFGNRTKRPRAWEWSRPILSAANPTGHA